MNMIGKGTCKLNGDVYEGERKHVGAHGEGTMTHADDKSAFGNSKDTVLTRSDPLSSMSVYQLELGLWCVFYRTLSLANSNTAVLSNNFSIEKHAARRRA